MSSGLSWKSTLAIVVTCGLIVLVLKGHLGAVWLLLLGATYVAPTLVAALYTRKRRWKEIAFWNVFFGLTGVGWLVCFVWACKPDTPAEMTRLKEQQRLIAEEKVIEMALKRAAASGSVLDQQELNNLVAQYRVRHGCNPQVLREELRKKAKSLADEYRTTHDESLPAKIRQLYKDSE